VTLGEKREIEFQFPGRGKMKFNKAEGKTMGKLTCQIKTPRFDKEKRAITTPLQVKITWFLCTGCTFFPSNYLRWQIYKANGSESRIEKLSRLLLFCKT
jgi:hypothetical protein